MWRMKPKEHWRQFAVRGESEPAPGYVGHSPLPYPESWYMLMPSAELGAGKVATRRLMGQDVVVYRTASGQARAVRAHCPHLGAHLGHGAVRGENIVCPFHQFAYDADGKIAEVGRGYTDKPKQSTLPVLHCQEANGGIFAWAGTGPPPWAIPEFLTPRHTPARYVTYDVPTHPQEILENGADTRHVLLLHGYGAAPRPAVLEGHILNQDIDLIRPIRPLPPLKLRAEIQHYGLGFSTIRINIAAVGLEQRILVSPRPVEPWRVHMAIGASIRITPPYRSGRGEGDLAQGVMKAVGRAMHPFVTWLLMREVNSDFQIWSSKKYTNPPRVAAGEGPIGPFRKWAQQFYPERPVRLWGNVNDPF
ncbi:Rieske 2Fe-2S domain-containing protein [Streptomyces sp. NPDC050617]|uniref:Rieske 2Fe-2S domain-containing protein n=1 Tax=Streptomyces sp. NPDC050617 TaxID=3154628 RepID=UPI003429AAB6